MNSRHSAVAEPAPVLTPERRHLRNTVGRTAVRLAALGGVAFFALLMVFATLTNGSPSATDSRQEIFSYFVNHHDRLQVAAVVYGLAMSATLLLVSGLFRALRRAEGGSPGLSVAALGGGVLAAASTVTGALILGTTAVRYVDLGPAGVRVGWTMFLLSIGATLLGLCVVIGATAVVSAQTRLFAGWFVVVSAVLALLSLLGAFTIGSTASGIQVVAGITAILDSVWLLLVSLFLWRDRTLTLP